MIVVADTSILLNLARVKHLDLLRDLFNTVLIPAEVAREFRHAAANLHRFHHLSLPSWIKEQSPALIPAHLRSEVGLDPGETAAIALAIEITADAILVDERRGHEVAIQLGLKAIGVLGILLEAKNRRLIQKIRPVLDQLEVEAQFWISPVIRQKVLDLAGE